VPGYLELDYQIVGVKLYNEKEAFDQSKATQRNNKSFYCNLVKKAAEGAHRKAALSNFACETSAKLLGLEDFYETKEGIDGWLESGLYANRTIAEQEFYSVFPVKEHTKGIEVGPLSKMAVDPDVVIIICKPYQAMRLVQGYTYHYGFKKDFQLSGMGGVCFESTVLPLVNNEFTVSLLCSGTRFVNQWPEEMMMVSFPFTMAKNLLKGVRMTAQRCEPDPYKARIIHRMGDNTEVSSPNDLTADRAYFYPKKGKKLKMIIGL
jgi:uncharacterized protein (DUF169 family)